MFVFLQENRIVNVYHLAVNKLHCESLQIVCNNDNFFREVNMQVIVQRVTLYHQFITQDNLILGEEVHIFTWFSGTFAIMLNLHPSINSLEMYLCLLISQTIVLQK